MARDFTVLAAARAEKQKGRGRGCPGLFIGTARDRNRQGLKELKRGGRSYCVEETVTGVVNARKKMALVGGSYLSAGERKKNGYRFGMS
jgi:hypothetical protein